MPVDQQVRRKAFVVYRIEHDESGRSWVGDKVGEGKTREEAERMADRYRQEDDYGGEYRVREEKSLGKRMKAFTKEVLDCAREIIKNIGDNDEEYGKRRETLASSLDRMGAPLIANYARQGFALYIARRIFGAPNASHEPAVVQQEFRKVHDQKSLKALRSKYKQKRLGNVKAFSPDVRQLAEAVLKDEGYEVGLALKDALEEMGALKLAKFAKYGPRAVAYAIVHGNESELRGEDVKEEYRRFKSLANRGRKDAALSITQLAREALNGNADYSDVVHALENQGADALADALADAPNKVLKAIATMDESHLPRDMDLEALRQFKRLKWAGRVKLLPIRGRKAFSPDVRRLAQAIVTNPHGADRETARIFGDALKEMGAEALGQGAATSDKRADFVAAAIHRGDVSLLPMMQKSEQARAEFLRYFKSLSRKGRKDAGEKYRRGEYATLTLPNGYSAPTNITQVLANDYYEVERSDTRQMYHCHVTQLSRRPIPRESFWDRIRML